MADTLQYIVDESGEKRSVLVPLKVWKQLNQDYQKLQNKLAVFSSIQSGLHEVATKGKPLQTLADFLA